MSTLRSAVDELSSIELGELSDAAVEEGFEELHRASEALEVERLRWLAELDRRRPYLRDGYLSTSSWMSHRLGVGWPSASGDVRSARALRDMPGAREALGAGDISLSASRVLMTARDTDPQAYASAEGLLVEAARRHELWDLQRVVAYWRAAAQARAQEARGEDPLHERRSLHVSPTAFGMVRIDGDLDPDAGETVLVALRACVDADARAGREDPRTPGQRRADALGEICRRFLDSPDRPAVGGERPHVTVTVSLEALRTGSGKPCELDHAGPVSPGAARRWSCDASAARVVLGPGSEPLDVGRRTSVVPAALRRAVVARDRGCRFPGCDRPPPWSDAHHIRHWADGGVTALRNLVLLCRPHHRLVHSGRFGLQVVDGPVFRRSDGSVLEDRAPP